MFVLIIIATNTILSGKIIIHGKLFFKLNSWNINFHKAIYLLLSPPSTPLEVLLAFLFDIATKIELKHM